MNYNYVKKPVVVQAFQMTKERSTDVKDWPDWLIEAINKKRHEAGAYQKVYSKATNNFINDYEIVTLEGNHKIMWGDYIIQGIEGELYPCKPSIFEQTYSKF